MCERRANEYYHGLPLIICPEPDTEIVAVTSPIRKGLSWNKSSILGNQSSIYELRDVNRYFRSLESQGGVMTTLQAMCLGAMLAWTLSLVVLASLLRETPLDELERDPS